MNTTYTSAAAGSPPQVGHCPGPGSWSLSTVANPTDFGAEVALAGAPQENRATSAPTAADAAAVRSSLRPMPMAAPVTR